MPTRTAFNFSDIKNECQIIEGHYSLDKNTLGLRIIVPDALQQQFPFNSSAYAFMQQLRQTILDYSIVEFPHLPLNKTNYTLAQKSPYQHLYSHNPYLTDYCQQPHQDTPPYPTAFWLPAKRQYFATWVISALGLKLFQQALNAFPQCSIMQLHQQLVPKSINDNWGLLLNHEPGLLLLDNSQRGQLFHARTCQFNQHHDHVMITSETPMYAFNEMGLMHYLDQLDERRGAEDRDTADYQAMINFLTNEKSNDLH